MTYKYPATSTGLSVVNAADAAAGRTALDVPSRAESYLLHANTNLVADGSYDRDAAWWSVETARTGIALSTERAYRGTQSIKITGPRAYYPNVTVSGKAGNDSTSLIATDEGRLYRLSFRVWREAANSTAGYIRGRIYVKGSNGNIDALNGYGSGFGPTGSVFQGDIVPGQWSEYNAYFIIPSSGTNFPYVGCYPLITVEGAGATDIYFIDDVRVEDFTNGPVEVLAPFPTGKRDVDTARIQPLVDLCQWYRGTLILRSGTYAMDIVTQKRDSQPRIIGQGKGANGTVWDGTLQVQGVSSRFSGGWLQGVLFDGSHYEITGTAVSGSTTSLADTSKNWAVNSLCNRVVRITSGTGSGQVFKVASNTVNTLTFVSSYAGIATSGTTTTLTDYNKSWRVNELKGETVTITSGTGSGQSFIVSWNSASQITFTTTSSVALDTTSVYSVNTASSVALNNTSVYQIDGQAAIELNGVCDFHWSEVRVYGYYDVGIWFNNELSADPGGGSDYAEINSGAASFYVRVRTALKYTQSNGQSSFHGSGLLHPSMISHSGTHPAILIENGCRPYNAPMNVIVWAGTMAVNSTATSGTTTTLTDSTKAWTVNAYKGSRVYIIDGAGKKQSFVIASNTATTLTLATTSSVALNNTSVYVIDFSYTGTASSGTTTTLVDSTRNWPVNFYKDYTLSVTAGAGAGQKFVIASNTATTLTLATTSSVALNNTSVYQLETAPIIQHNGNIQSNFSGNFCFENYATPLARGNTIYHAGTFQSYDYFPVDFTNFCLVNSLQAGMATMNFPDTRADKITNIAGTETITVGNTPRLVCVTAPGGVGTEDGGNTWAKIATISTGTGTYQQVNLALRVVAGLGNAESATVAVGVRTSTSPTSPQVSVYMDSKAAIASAIQPDSFKIISGGWGSDAELWFRKGRTYCQPYFYEIGREIDGVTTTITYNDGAAWQSAAPVGAVSNLSSSGVTSFGQPVGTWSKINVTTTYTLPAQPNHRYIVLVNTSGATTLTLPTAVGNTSLYVIKNVTSVDRTLSATSPQTIENSATLVLPAGAAAEIVSDDSNWRMF